MEGIVAKRTLKKSYYNNKNITNTMFETIPFNNIKENKKKEKTKFEQYKEKLLFKICIQSITMISIIIFVLGIKLLKIDIVIESDIAKKITNYYQKTYSLNQVLTSTKLFAKAAYIYSKPIIPDKIEDKAKEIYKILLINKQENNYLENKPNKENINNSEVLVYEESGINNKENTVKENVGVSADVKEDKEKSIAVSSSVSSELNIIDKIKATKIKFIKPVFGTITSHFGAREVIFEGIDSYHTGTDIAASKGTKIVSSIEGKVTRASYNKYNGNFVEVTNGKIATIYCHMNKLSVEVGDKVKAGTKIGEVGSTGLSTGPHLHFEIVYDGTKVDPEQILEL